MLEGGDVAFLKRDLRFDLVQTGEWSAGTGVTFDVLLDGLPVHHSVVGTAPSRNQMTATFIEPVPAFLPAVIVVTGGGGPPGGCVSIRGTIAYSTPR